MHEASTTVGRHRRDWPGSPSRPTRFKTAIRSWSGMPWAATAAVTVPCGLALAVSPVAALIPLGFALLALLIISSWARVLLVVFGGVFVFGGTQSVSGPKIAYFPCLLLALLISGYRCGLVFHRLSSMWRWALLAAGALSAWATFTFFVSHANGVSSMDWLRDTVAYYLLAGSVVFAVDLGMVANPFLIRRALMLAGLVAALGTAVGWTSRRGVSTLGVGYIAMPSFGLAAIGIAAGAALWLRGKEPVWGFVVFVVSLASMLVPGTRTNLILFPALLLLFGAIRLGLVPWLRFWSMLLPAFAGVLLMVIAMAELLLGGTAFLIDRLRAVGTVVSSGVAADASGVDRTVAYQSVVSRWKESPFIGVGPGNFYRDRFGALLTNLDTPLITLSKIGLVGAILLVGFYVVYFAAARVAAAPERVSWPIARTYLAVLILVLPFGGALEDKGTAYALLLLGALTIAEQRRGDLMWRLHPLEEPTVAAVPLDGRAAPGAKTHRVDLPT